MLTNFGGADMAPDEFGTLLDDFWVNCIVAHMRVSGLLWKSKEQLSDQEMNQVDSIGVQVPIITVLSLTISYVVEPSMISGFSKILVVIHALFSRPSQKQG